MTHDDSLENLRLAHTRCNSLRKTPQQPAELRSADKKSFDPIELKITVALTRLRKRTGVTGVRPNDVPPKAAGDGIS